MNPSDKPKPTSTERTSRMLHLANLWIIAAFMFVAFTALLLLDRPTVSDIENRKLAEFPSFSMQSLFAGAYTDSISTYFNDTVPGRDNFKRMASRLNSLLGFALNDTMFYNVVELPGSDSSNASGSDSTDSSFSGGTSGSGEQSGVVIVIPNEDHTTPGTDTESSSGAESSSPESSSSSQSSSHPNEIEDGIITNGILVVGDRGIMLYGGGFGVGEQYAGYVNAYKRDLGPDVSVYSMVIPTSVAYYLPEQYAGYTSSQKDNIEHIRKYLSGVADVDVYSALQAHTAEDIYTRTDHHWAALGGYYAAQEFAKQAGVPFAELSTYEEETIDGYVGTLYSYTQDARLLNNPEEFVFYKPANQYTTTYYDCWYRNAYEHSLFVDFTHSKGSLYCTFMGGDQKIVRIQTDAGNGRKLAIFKDSYGNALVPFLTGSFEEIYVIDIRYMELNAIRFLKQQGVTDVLFATCAFTATGGNAHHIERIRTMSSTSPSVPSSSSSSESSSSETSSVSEIKGVLG